MIWYIKQRCHPHFSKHWSPQIGKLISNVLGTQGVVAIGECGMDKSHK